MSKNRLLSVVDVHVIFVNELGEWLFSRRANTGYKDGEFSFVAGHLEEKESLKQCAIREAKEEANVSIGENDLELAHVMRRDADHVRISFFFKCHKWADVIKNMEPHKCSELSWHHPNVLVAPMVDYVKYASEQILNSCISSDFNY